MVQAQAKNEWGGDAALGKGFVMFTLANQVRCLFLAVALALAGPAIVGFSTTVSAASIVATVNGKAITTGDLNRRISFLRLKRTKGNLKQIARKELIDEMLKREEIIRVGASVSTQEVEASYQRFAAGNKLTPKQLASILNQSGVTVGHFKSYIAVSMSWPNVVRARYGSGGTKAVQDLVERMSERGEKPKTTEFMLQQVIFVVPERRRSAILGKRKREAQAARKKYPGCEQGKVFAATMHDVSIRDLGRILEPQLPGNWKKQIVATDAGGTTPVQATERGIEFIAVCGRREVSDDAAAEVVFQAEDLQQAEAAADDPNSERYLKELREKAYIVEK